MLSPPEQRVLATFREFLMTPGRMLCFSGPNLASKKAALKMLTDKGLLVKEEFAGGYSLTRSGFSAMKNECELGADT